jgi:hypothetical protein
MACWLNSHEWGWPRRRGDVDTQVCVRCGASRAARIQFGARCPDPADNSLNVAPAAKLHSPAQEISVVH